MRPALVKSARRPAVVAVVVVAADTATGDKPPNSDCGSKPAHIQLAPLAVGVSHLFIFAQTA
jgi:hypothetical protein